MIKVIFPLRTVLLIGIPLVFSFCSRIHHLALEPRHREDFDPAERQRWENAMLADPATGKIPDHIRAKELAFAATLPQQPEPMNKYGAFWQNRGPWNIAGRTRAVVIDITNEHIIMAGGVSGGIWRSTDDGLHWSKIMGPAKDYSISCLVQDTRSGKTNIWYAGTGETIGDNGNVHGDGILKSTDGGQSFFKLASTSHGMPQNNFPMDNISSIAINTADTGNVLYAATGGFFGIAYDGSIYKSTDGGNTWTHLTGIATGCYNTEVAISKKGVLYSTNDQSGIYRSTDGITNTRITPKGFPGSYGRMVIGIDPNDENTVYFLAAIYNGKGWVASLWKYRYLSGNGTGAGGAWKDLSANIPVGKGGYGDFAIQGGYNLLVSVKPGDSKTVFLGATNLWRSTDSFSSKNNSAWIGGYPVAWDGESLSPCYRNHHPDQHKLVFYPSDPDKMLSANDGGLFRTNDNKAATVVWDSLNNGYITTQFYRVAIDHGTPGSEDLVGGMQDNEVYLTHSANQEDPWNQCYISDGAYCVIADGGIDYYVSQVYGDAYHIRPDANGAPTLHAWINPPHKNVPFYDTPFLLDPNNQKRMYFLYGNCVWRNNDITQIPLIKSSIADDSTRPFTGWDSLRATANLVNKYSALAMTKTSPAERIVYGTSNGHLFRMDSADATNPTQKEITGSVFPKNAFVNCIAINPVNGDEMIVVFSNFNIKSLFHTINGGMTWEDISGNLEQFPDGTGNGPSCRWAAVLPVGHHYAFFIGTSTGLYGTDTLKGTKTTWTQQGPNEIGNILISQIDTRPSDGRVALATYGNGVITANINFSYQVSGIEEEMKTMHNLMGMHIYPNPVASYGILQIRFTSPLLGNATEVNILNEEGKTVQVVNNFRLKQEMTIPLSGLPKGVYYLHIKLGVEMVTRAFVVQ